MTQKPFPNEQGLQFGCKPALEQSELNRDVAQFYDFWKREYLEAAVSYPGCYYVSTGGGTNVDESAITVSEGHGYGMISVVLMAGYDKDAQKIFDGMVEFYRAHPSPTDPALPSWQVLGKVGEYETDDCFGSATDGDFDVAYALLLAHTQWGSDGAVDYLALAKEIIPALYRHDIHDSNLRILLGDWVKDPESELKYKNATRPSDWMPAHIKAYEMASGNDEWRGVADTIYTLAEETAHEKTGLLPDFVVGDTPEPAEPNFLERFTDGSYAANACRVPWRIGMDFIQHGDARAQKVLNNIMSWLNESCNGSVHKMCNGYHLDGTPIWEENIEPRGMYAGPFMVAALVDEQYNEYATSSWKHLRECKPEAGYYSNSITLLTLLAASGNWWIPAV